MAILWTWFARIVLLETCLYCFCTLFATNIQVWFVDSHSKNFVLISFTSFKTWHSFEQSFEDRLVLPLVINRGVADFSNWHFVSWDFTAFQCHRLLRLLHWVSQNLWNSTEFPWISSFFEISHREAWTFTTIRCIYIYIYQSNLKT